MYYCFPSHQKKKSSKKFVVTLLWFVVSSISWAFVLSEKKKLTRLNDSKQMFYQLKIPKMRWLFHTSLTKCPLSHTGNGCYQVNFSKAVQRAIKYSQWPQHKNNPNVSLAKFVCITKCNSWLLNLMAQQFVIGVRNYFVLHITNHGWWLLHKCYKQQSHCSYGFLFGSFLGIFLFLSFLSRFWHSTGFLSHVFSRFKFMLKRKPATMRVKHICQSLWLANMALSQSNLLMLWKVSF